MGGQVTAPPTHNGLARQVGLAYSTSVDVSLAWGCKSAVLNLSALTLASKDTHSAMKCPYIY